MSGNSVERLWTWLHDTFPERQIYVRSEGRVQFFTFGPTLQATLAGLTLIFLGWVAFTSVNVIFKDRIIAAKDRRYQQMQLGYESRIADLQTSYDELNVSVVAAEDRFKSVADQLEIKQANVAKLLGRKQAIENALGEAGLAPQHVDTSVVTVAKDAASGAALDSVDGSAAARPGASPGATQLNLISQPAASQPRSGRPRKASLLEMAVTRFAALIHSPHARSFGRGPNPPALRGIAYQTQRLIALDHQQTEQLVAADQAISQRVSQLQSSLRRVGVEPNDLERHQNYRMGGIFLPLSSMKIDGIADPAFVEAYGGVIAHAKQLDSLFATISHVPLTTPVHGSQFEITSEFGPRIDPINHRLGFHPGLDFGGPWGAEVRATAPGTVVFAGQKGGYGNLVEIDHGFGFHTRYGHLSALLVHVGTRIAKGTPVGKLGSTGRSTGPHVHYEVFYADVVRDPSRYIEAGRHVFE